MHICNSYQIFSTLKVVFALACCVEVYATLELHTMVFTLQLLNGKIFVLDTFLCLKSSSVIAATALIQ